MSKNNPGDVATMGDLQRTHDTISKAVETHLQTFQQEVMVQVGRTNMVFNTVNVILRAFMDKGLITEVDVVKAGRDLMSEAQEDLKRARAVENDPGLVVKPSYSPTPLDVVGRVLDGVKKELRGEKGDGN